MRPLLLLALWMSGPEALAADGQAELTQAIVAFGRGDRAAARKHLDDAEKVTTDPVTLARIHRQRGIIEQVEGHRLKAVVAFMKAHYFDKNVELSEREHRGEVQRLFQCARALHQRGVSEKSVEAQHAERFDKSDWQCPGAKPAPPPAPPKLAPPPPNLTPPPPSAEPSGGDSVWTSPVLWIIVGGVVVAGGATAAGILIAGREEPYGGSTNVNIELRP